MESAFSTEVFPTYTHPDRCSVFQLVGIPVIYAVPMARLANPVDGFFYAFAIANV